MTTFKHEIFESGFECLHDGDHARIFRHESTNALICESISEYIPMTDFKKTFDMAGKFVSDLGIKYFVFDKRYLTTFHQPSMEWYFVEWKQQMRDLGLVNHFKILPKLDWFKSSVEAGYNDIIGKYGKDVTKGIRIQYVDSIREAIDRIGN